MQTITIIPKNEEVMPFITELLSNNNEILDFKINDNYVNDYSPHIPNKETLEAIKEVEEGKAMYIGSIDDYLEWSKNV